ncbi:MAG: fasciclin domain-containing protein [Chloroflexi bacterium]|nr:fasciclin domain-containing protein [Chloroflexota bacterium]
MKTIIQLTVICLICLVTACTPTLAPDPQEIIVPQPTADKSNLLNIADALAANPDTVFWFTALTRIGFTETLRQGEGFTLFVPNNQTLAENFIRSSEIDDETLIAIAQNQLIDQVLEVEDLEQVTAVTTMLDTAVTIQKRDNQLMLDYLTIDPSPIQTQNGIIYFIDGILLPPTGSSIWDLITSEEDLSTFTNLIIDTPTMYAFKFNNHADAVLAPTNDAIASMPINVLNAIQSDPEFMEYWSSILQLAPDGWPSNTPLTLADIKEMETVHTILPVSGSGFGFGYVELTVTNNSDTIMLDDATIIKGDITATNGTLHIIDAVPVTDDILEFAAEIAP